jgi:hypothetical protein
MVELAALGLALAEVVVHGAAGAEAARHVAGFARGAVRWRVMLLLLLLLLLRCCRW